MRDQTLSAPCRSAGASGTGKGMTAVIPSGREISLSVTSLTRCGWSAGTEVYCRLPEASLWSRVG